MSPTRRPLSLHLRLAVWRSDEYVCQHCRGVGSWLSLEVDHIVPIALGGSDMFENLQTLCRGCNRRKGARFVG